MRHLIISAIFFSLFSYFSCAEPEKKGRISSEYSNLTDEQKHSLAYMWHEEKLAYDLYIQLNKNTPAQQLENIAHNSESKHINLVQDLVEKYNLDITNATNIETGYSEEVLTSMPMGTYQIDKIQNLYDSLYQKGSKSLKDALEVGCMVEVTDIDDLDHYIDISKNAQDLIDTYKQLRAGSYSHYWAFDQGLKNLGVSDGCCSLGTIDGVNYCHPEYPK